MWLYLCLHEIKLYSTLSPGSFPHYSSNFLLKGKQNQNENNNQKPNQTERHTYLYIFVYIFKHVSYLFLIAMDLGKSLLLMRFKIVV